MSQPPPEFTAAAATAAVETEGEVDGALASTGAGEPPRRLVLLLAVACGLTVANLYYAQPLLSSLRQVFGIDAATAGWLVTISQIGYALGLLFIVPLGDRLENRRLVTVLLGITAASLVVAGTAPGYALLLGATLLFATTLVVVQILVPYAADLAPSHIRGRIVGQVMSGLLAGILLSRTLGSLLAQATDWRVVYLTSAALMAVLALVLRTTLPTRRPRTGAPYPELLRSTARLMRQHPPLRRRALYQATMFGAFSAFWTTVSFVLTGAPFHYNQLGVGLFALVGAGGVLIAPLAGRWADRGLGRPMTAAALLTAALAFGLAGVGRHSIIALGAAAILLDMAVQTTLILGQHVIFQLDPASRARLNSAYMATFFLGGALGSQVASTAYRADGWPAVATLGAALPAAGLLLWATERHG
ncbi:MULTISPECIES: MFS transporter [Streptacidiphilus]|uniref:MFS transporter n=1 Tax=Streptacidiphilus cavernicola TaxID=3342716 RepID=A0ABV6V1S5_9ACTN|nr:MFS transporter [Streptacidiphilus jeojiense]